MAAALLLAPLLAAAQDKPGQDKPTAAAAKPRPALPAGFHLVLLVGDEKQAAAAGTMAPSWAEQLTPAVVKALKDVQQFLPFKSYQVFDSTFIRGDGGSTSIKSPGNQIYVARVNSWAPPPNRLAEGRFYVSLDLAPSGGIITAGKGGTSVLNTTFDMTTGETIVAGTSRQPISGTALVMVVTALPPSALHQ
jgi:hypothetical protein